ncbi:La [Bugula neritina]|uniref:La n=1 Tax=Bugula neritina TaxID=10212 RepID=A0A7J7JJ07_BUGNE|nr:La [Bugula neritina]
MFYFLLTGLRTQTQSNAKSRRAENDIRLLKRAITGNVKNANLDKDKFMNEEIKKNEGWILLTTLLTFNRLKAMSEDAKFITAALRKSTNDLLEGSVFVLFKTTELAKEFLTAEEIKYKDTPLIERLFKQDYFKKKQEEKLGGKIEDIRKKDEQKKKREQEEREELLARITRSSVLKVTGIPDETPIDKIKEFFGKYGDVAWVDFGKGDDHAKIRYATENEAKVAWDKALEEAKDKKVLFDEKELTGVVIEGEEEETHWKKFFESIQNRYKKNKPGHGGRGGKGGRGGFKRRNAGDGDGASKEKRSRND